MTLPYALQVTTDHLRDLAATHTAAAAEVDEAHEVATDLARSLAASHGVIAASTAAVVTDLQAVRRQCVAAIAAEGRAFGANVDAAAGRYESTDDSGGVVLDRQVHPQ